MSDSSWRNHPFFEGVKSCPGAFVNARDDDFVYLNLNPRKAIGQDDQLFQIIRFFNKERTDKDIVDIITKRKIKSASPFLDARDIANIIEKLWHLRYFTVERKMTTKEFVDLWRSLDTRYLGWVIVRFGKTLELFNTKDCKFYGCHPIEWAKKVSGYWIYERPDENEN